MKVTFHPHLATTAIPPLELDPAADVRLAILECVTYYEGHRPGLDVTVNTETTDGCVWFGPHSADLGWRIVIDADGREGWARDEDDATPDLHPWETGGDPLGEAAEGAP